MKLCLKLIPLVAIATFSSCEQRELCYDHSHTVDLDVRYDWSLAPDASPESMSLYMFPYSESSNTTGKGQRYEIVGKNGDRIRVTAGRYDIISFNSDPRGLRVNGLESTGSLELSMVENPTIGSGVSIPQGAPRAEGTEDEPIMQQPPMIWAHHIIGVTIHSADADDPASQIQQLELRPEPIVETYRLSITNIQNLQYVKSLSGAISGMQGGVNVHRKLSRSSNSYSPSVTIPFEAVHNLADNTISGEIQSFGLSSDDNQSAQHLMLYITLTDNSKVYYETNISDQLKNADTDTHEMTINIGGLVIPEPTGDPSGGGGGITPDINDWGNINITLPM